MDRRWANYGIFCSSCIKLDSNAKSGYYLYLSVVIYTLKKVSQKLAKQTLHGQMQMDSNCSIVLVQVSLLVLLYWIPFLAIYESISKILRMDSQWPSDGILCTSCQVALDAVGFQSVQIGLFISLIYKRSPKNNFHWMCTLIMSRVVGSLLLLHGKVRMSYCIRWERVCIGLHYIPDQQEAIEISHNTSRLKVVYSHSLIINPSIGMYQETHPKRPIGKGFYGFKGGKDEA